MRFFAINNDAHMIPINVFILSFKKIRGDGITRLHYFLNSEPFCYFLELDTYDYILINIFNQSYVTGVDLAFKRAVYYVLDIFQ